MKCKIILEDLKTEVKNMSVKKKENTNCSEAFYAPDDQTVAFGENEHNKCMDLKAPGAQNV